MTTLVRFDPYRNVTTLQGEMGRFLSQLFVAGNGATTPSVWAPAMDVWETDGEIVYAFDLPGIAKEAVSIEYEHGVLTVSAERERSQEVSTERLYRFERRYGSFSRTIGLPKGVTEDQNLGSRQQRRARSPRHQARAGETAPDPDQQRQGRDRGQGDQSLGSPARLSEQGAASRPPLSSFDGQARPAMQLAAS